MKRKNFVAAVAAMVMAATMSMTAFAAGWQQNTTGWWYATNDAGTEWYANGWQWVDGNNDGVAECYYFDGNGYMLVNTTTPDGYIVNGDGAWILNGIVQAQGTHAGNDIANDGNVVQNSDNGGYNSYGCSNAALEILHNSREENAKFGEIKVEESVVGLGITYANGFIVGYPYEGTSRYKTVSVDPERTDLDGKYLFKYYDSSLTPEQAADMLQNNGFTDGRGEHYAYAIGTTCRAHVADRADINWGKSYILLR